MKLRRHLPLTGLISVLSAWAFLPGAHVANAQNFTVTAVPVNTGSGGATASVSYTVSHIPENGSLIIGCAYSGSTTFQEQAKLPLCGIGPPIAITVTAGQTVTGTLSVVPWGTPVPAVRAAREQGFHGAPAAGLVLAAGLLAGFWRRRKDRRWLRMTLIAAAAFLLAVNTTACGGNSSAGIYPYTVTAALTQSTTTPLSMQTSTSVNVTVE